jgi:predicted transcriptional regulator YdeE
VELVDRPAIEVIGIQVEAAFDALATVVPAAWTDLFERADAIIGRTGTTYLELSTDLGHGRYRELVGAQVVGGTPPPPGMLAELVYEARWVHELHHGPLEGIGATFGQMLDFVAHQGLHADGVKLDVGYGTDGPHDLYVRLTQ